MLEEHHPTWRSPWSPLPSSSSSSHCSPSPTSCPAGRARRGSSHRCA